MRQPLFHFHHKPQLHNAPPERCYACLGTADRRHAQWNALTRRARRGRDPDPGIVSSVETGTRMKVKK